METKGSWFIEERAIHLSILHLTRREGLVVTQPVAEYGLDILVEIHKDGKATGRMFGGQIQGCMHLQKTRVDSSDGNEFAVPVPIPLILEDLPFPLCLFVFEMENDEGCYRWINKPIISPDSIPKLSLIKENIFRMLTREELDALVEQVDAWYEKRRVAERRSLVYT